MKLFKMLMSASFIVFIIYIANLVFMVNEDLKSNEPVSKDPALSEEELNQKVYDSLMEQGLDEYAEISNDSSDPKNDTLQETISTAKSEELIIRELRYKTNVTAPPLEDSDVIQLSVYDLITSLESDIETAKSLYEGRWLNLTGKVVCVEHEPFRVSTMRYKWSDEPIYYPSATWSYTINEIQIKSNLIYYLAVSERFVNADVVVAMDTELCKDPENENKYSYYSQNSTVTVLAYCASIEEKYVVLVDGRYPK